MEDFLRTNVTPRTYLKLVRKPACFPVFWCKLFCNWFKYCYVFNIIKGGKLNKNVLKKGILFHSCSRPRWNFATYNLLKDLQCFTFEEVRLVWEYIPHDSQCQILNSFQSKYRHVISAYFNGSDDDYYEDSPVTSLYSTIIQPQARTRHIYVFMRDGEFVFPVHTIAKWERDLNINIGEDWLNICKKTQCLDNPRLRSFHIQFLHRVYHLNTVMAYYTDCSAMCSFCKSSAETHAHFYWIVFSPNAAGGN